MYVGVFVRVGADDARVPIFTVIANSSRPIEYEFLPGEAGGGGGGAQNEKSTIHRPVC